MDVDLTPIEARLSACSHGTWGAYRMTHAERGDNLTPDELGEYVKNSVVKSAGESGSLDFLFVSVEKATGAADVCHVGNGPTSPANADFIAHAPSDMTVLVAEVKRLRAALARRASLPQLTHGEQHEAEANEGRADQGAGEAGRPPERVVGAERRLRGADAVAASIGDAHQQGSEAAAFEVGRASLPTAQGDPIRDVLLKLEGRTIQDFIDCGDDEQTRVVSLRFLHNLAASRSIPAPTPDDGAAEPTGAISAAIAALERAGNAIHSEYCSSPKHHQECAAVDDAIAALRAALAVRVSPPPQD